jgi:hypothetical protein
MPNFQEASLTWSYLLQVPGGVGCDSSLRTPEVRMEGHDVASKCDTSLYQSTALNQPSSLVALPHDFFLFVVHPVHSASMSTALCLNYSLQRQERICSIGN